MVVVEAGPATTSSWSRPSGVGQSEVTVAEMVRTPSSSSLARTGDQLEGIKRGILAIADVIGGEERPARAPGRSTPAGRRGACRRDAMLRGHGADGWDARCSTCAGTDRRRAGAVWAKLVEHQERMEASASWRSAAATSRSTGSGSCPRRAGTQACGTTGGSRRGRTSRPPCSPVSSPRRSPPAGPGAFLADPAPAPCSCPGHPASGNEVPIRPPRSGPAAAR